MKKNTLIIPSMAETAINSRIEDLVDLGLQKEYCLFILGSLMYESPNSKGEKQFNKFVKKLPHFKNYLSYLLENEFLTRGQRKNYFLYCHDINCDRDFQRFEFDSITLNKIIEKQFPDFSKYFTNLFQFLKPERAVK